MEPVPNRAPTQVGKWNVEYAPNQYTGEQEAWATHPKTLLTHDAILDESSGTVRFGLRGTAEPPQYVKNHIMRQLLKGRE
jgi:hypothetical protein